MIGIIFAGFGLSPAVFSPLQTLIINPGKEHHKIQTNQFLLSKYQKLQNFQILFCYIFQQVTFSNKLHFPTSYIFQQVTFSNKLHFSTSYIFQQFAFLGLLQIICFR